MRKQREVTQFVGRSHWVLGVILLLAAVGLAYEVTLTRLFSVIFQYHYVFLIVSVSIAGMSVGAGLATWAGHSPKAGVDWSDLTYAALMLAFLMVGVVVVLAQLPSASFVLVALIAALLPFVSIGFLNALLFAHFAQSGGVVYAADLLGGAVGVALALGLVGWLGAFNAVLALAVVCAGIGLLLAWMSGARVVRLRAAGFLVVIAVAFVVNNAVGVLAFAPEKLTDAPPDKTLMQVLQDPQAALVETRWDPFARLDVVTTGDDSLRYVFTDAGAGSIMLRYDGDNQKVAWVQQEIEYLPFTVDAPNTKRVLILGAGAGRDVVMARLAGAEAITAVEINPALVALTRESSIYNGNIFDLPGVQTIALDGRNFVERSSATYDLIYANVVYSQAAAPGSTALSENYIFTREALRIYWKRLSDNGRLGFATHQGIEGIRLVIGLLDMLQGEGLTAQAALKHVAFASLSSGDVETRTSVVIALRQPWTNAEADAFSEAVHQRGAGALHLPHYQELGFESIATGLVSLSGYIESNREFNYAPATDDRPFFYQLRPGLPEGLSGLVWIEVFVVLAYLAWLVFFFVRQDQQQWKRASLAPYFSLLGAAYLLVEIPLIQRFSLLLGQPTLALVVVLGALLVGSGAGSLFSSRFPVEQLPRLVVLIGVVIGAAVVVTLWLYPALIQWAMPLDLAVRVLVTTVALLPLGFVMGVPFPCGLRVAHEADPQGVAAFWGANAATSVLGSALAMGVAVLWGFSAALILGAVLYVGAAGLVYRTWHKVLA